MMLYTFALCLGIGFAALAVLAIIACAMTMPPPRDPNEQEPTP